MNQNKLLPALLTILAAAAPAIGTLTAHANNPPPWTVSLDANSTSSTDAAIDSTNNPPSSFSIGAIINASSTHPVNGVYAWQFSIIYDNTSSTPQNQTSGPLNGVRFGSQSTTGNPNWAARVSAQTAFGNSKVTDVDPTHRKVRVYFTLLGTSLTVNIAPTLSPTIQGNLLANVNFTILHTPTSPVIFTITDTALADNTGTQIPNINDGSPITVGPPSQTSPGTTLPYLIVTIVAVTVLAVLVLRRRRAK